MLFYFYNIYKSEVTRRMARHLCINILDRDQDIEFSCQNLNYLKKEMRVCSQCVVNYISYVK
jgi:hypothetical protein